MSKKMKKKKRLINVYDVIFGQKFFVVEKFIPTNKNKHHK